MSGLIEKMVKNKVYLIWLVCLFSAIIYLYSAQFFFDQQLSPTNFMYFFSPWDSEQVSILGPLLSDPADSVLPNLYNIYHNGLIGLWDNMTALGIPAELGRYLYPLNWVYILPFEYAIIIRSILEYLVAFFSMYFLLKSMQIDNEACIIGGIIYTFSSTMIVWHFWPHSDVAAFAPLAFLFARNLIFKKRHRDIILLGVVEGIMLLASMPTYVAYFDYLLGIYFVYLTIKTYGTDWKKIVLTFSKFTLGILLAVFISLPYTIGILDSAVSSGYSASREYMGQGTLDINYLVSLLFPLASLGDMHINESFIYAGTLSISLLPLMFVGYKTKKKNNLLFWSISLIILFVLIFTHSLDFIFTKIPAIHTSLKTRVIVLVGFVFAIIDAICIDDILKNRETYKNKVIPLVIGYIVFLGLYIWIRSFYLDYEYLSKIDICMVLSILLILCFTIHRKKIWIYFLIAVTIYNGETIAKRYMPFIPNDVSVIPEATDSIRYLQEEAGDSVILVVGDAWTFFPNTNVYYDLRMLSGHSLNLTDKLYFNYYLGIDDTCFQSPTRVQFGKIDNYNLLRYLGVQYIAVNRDYTMFTSSDYLNNSDLKLVYSGVDGLDIYKMNISSNRFEYASQVYLYDTKEELLEAMKQEYIPGSIHVINSDSYVENISAVNNDVLQKDEEQIEILKDSNDCISLKTRNTQSEYLIFNEYYDKNWKVYVNGKEQKLINSNYLTRAVLLEEGQNFVEFRYENSSIYITFIISGCTIVSIGAASIIVLIKRKKRVEII